MSRLAQGYWELEVYQAAFRLQQDIFRLTRQWPAEERYALTDQVRRSSRSVGANLAEAWAKRRYPAHFLSKLTDADGEAQETRHWLETARACEYLSGADHAGALAQLQSVGGMLRSMIVHYETFTLS